MTVRPSTRMSARMLDTSQPPHIYLRNGIWWYRQQGEYTAADGPATVRTRNQKAEEYIDWLQGTRKGRA